MTTAIATKTMTAAQMAWSLKKGFAWADPDNATDDDDYSGLGDVYWTREGGYMWDVSNQRYEMVI